MSGTERPRIVWWTRVGVMAVVATFIVLSPSARQVFGSKSKTLRAWVMFSGYATKACDVRWRVNAPGPPRDVDRFEAVGGNPWWTQSRSARRIERREIDHHARQLCRGLGPGTDLRVFSRCGSRRGWKPVHDGQHNVCETGTAKTDGGS